MRAHLSLLCILLSAVAISADLQSDLEEVSSFIPYQEIVSIGKQYVKADPSYGDGLRYINTVTYEKLVNDFLATKEGEKLIEYFKTRGIDAEIVFLFITKQTTELLGEWLKPMEEDEEKKFVISGNIMADYRKAVLDSEFLNEVHQKMESSPEFSKLVAAFKDPEFRARFYRSANSKALKGFGKNIAVRGFWANVWGAIKKVFSIATTFFG